MDTSPDCRVDALLRAARSQIDPVDAEWLLAHALGRPRTWLYSHGSDLTDPAASHGFAALVARRALGEPVAYLTGRRGFWTFELQVSPATLIPRPETEVLVEQALARLPLDCDLRLADLGTGSGAIALALAQERARSTVTATDVSEAALAVARENAAVLGVSNICFSQGEWCAALDGGDFDLIVSNPPYIAAGDPHLQDGDLRFEPDAALASGVDGLDAIRAIVNEAPARLLRGGWLLLEHGLEQGEAVRALLQEAGLVEIATQRDLEHRERVTGGRRAC